MRAMLLIAALTALALAQPPSPSPSPAANQPVTIFSYKAELGLSDDQVARMQARLQALKTSMAENQKKMAAVKQEYVTMMASESTPLPTIEAKLKEFYALQVISTMDDLKASRDILAILSADQLKKWRAIQTEVRAKTTPK